MRFLLSLMMLLAIAWAATLAWFIHAMPKEPAVITRATDAMIVLTGGQGRVEHGLRLLAQQAAPLLLVTGVGDGVTEEELMDAHASAETREQIYEAGGKIVLDHVARSTVSNADQTNSFVRANGVRSIRLITADYHMMRSLKEFRAAMPDIEIVPDPVFPTEFRRDAMWSDDITRRLIFTEFYKYLVVVVRDWLKPPQALAAGAA
jgi:uncharacterized SAM-binding protein YcdF (DUF218 family)